MSNPFSALFDDAKEDNKEKSTSNLTKCSELTLSREFERIFSFTINKERSDKHEYMYLGADITEDLINFDIFSQCLWERLFNSGKENPLIQETKAKGFNNSQAFEDRIVIYLYNCYKLLKESTVLSTKDLHDITNEVFRHLGTGFTNPEIYGDQCLVSQLIEVLKEGQPYYETFFLEIVKVILKEEKNENISAEVGLKDVIKKMVAILLLECHKTPLYTFELSIFTVLNALTLDEITVGLFMDSIQPAKPEVGASYANTLLGALFNLSILPKSPSGSFEHFQEPFSQASISSVEGMLWSKSDKLTEHIHNFLLNLLKCKNIKSRVLLWLGQCLKGNSDRGKLWNSHAPIEMNPAYYTNVSDGFMLQLCNVLARFCKPFSTELKVLKVDPTYSSVPNEKIEEKTIHMYNLSEETCLVPSDDPDQERLMAENYNFITECFFMTHRAIHLGFSLAVEKLVKLNQEIVRIDRAYNESMQQASGNSDVLSAIKDRMTAETSKFLSYKAQVCEPNFVKSLFNFISASASWLCQISLHQFSAEETSFAPLKPLEVEFPLSDRVPDTLKCVPEFLISNVANFMVFLMRFTPKEFELQEYDKTSPLLTFILVYMGNGNLIRNPHLRAQLAEALEALLPSNKDHASNLNSNLGNYQGSRLFTQHTHKHQIVRSLLEVFVGIEMTGQSVEFEQKFNYRRPMYTVMEYLWNIEEYRRDFEQLAEEAERTMEDVTPPIFLRFVNLLMNDAVYLLDESLSNMAKIREMQTARDNGKWDSLPARERTQNLGYLQHISTLARFDNILGKDTIKTLERLTSIIDRVFTHTTMVDRMAAMLNYFLLNLVGPNKKNFKVKDPKESYFDPAQTVLTICKIYVNLKESDSFCRAVSQDGRSYSPQLFSYARDVLVRIGGSQLIEEIDEVAERVAEKAREYRASEEMVSNAPDRFLDPIMSTLMTDPVILPSSRQTVDRTTIARHLLSDQTDPFNRAPLSLDQVIPNTELAEEISRWITEKKAS